MNKMQRPEQEITRYGAEDVIATSGGNEPSIDPVGGLRIWLDAGSVDFYNKVKDNDINLSTIYEGFDWKYYAYEGNVVSKGGTPIYSIAIASDDKPSAVVNKVFDETSYNMVRTWLENPRL